MSVQPMLMAMENGKQNTALGLVFCFQLNYFPKKGSIFGSCVWLAREIAKFLFVVFSFNLKSRKKERETVKKNGRRREYLRIEVFESVTQTYCNWLSILCESLCEVYGLPFCMGTSSCKTSKIWRKQKNKKKTFLKNILHRNKPALILISVKKVKLN